MTDHQHGTAVATAGADAASASRGSGALSPLFTGLLGLLIGLAVGAALFSGSGGGSAADGDAGTLVAADEVPRSSLGADDAPVTVTLYSDFLCPYCQQHDQQVEPELVERYVETGEVRLVWHDLPLQGPGAMDLAVAGRAAELQDGFWEFKEEVFSHGADPAPEAVAAAADRAGLDTDRFQQDLDDPALELAVRRDLEQARQLGVQATPAFIVGDQGMMGLQSIEALAAAIEEAG